MQRGKQCAGDGPPSAEACDCEREHDAAGDLLARLRAATRDYTTPEDGCSSYQLMMVRLEAMEKDIHEHIHKENNVLFPRSLAECAA